MRLCSGDCDDAQLVAVTDPSIVAKLAFVSGEVTANDPSGESRPLHLQAPLRAGDTVTTGPGALAIIVYRDESRTTLRSDSAMEIVALDYDPEDADRNSAVMRFLKGGVRILSGAISKVRPRKYRVETPVAILSVRGTGFDLVCAAACSAAQAAAAAGDGMDIWVFEGAVGFPLAGGDYVVDQGRAVFFDGVAAPRPYPQVPVQLQRFSWPEPDPSLEGQDLFGAPAPDDGLYVRVNEGTVEVSDGTGPDIVADAGETVFGAGGGDSLELLDGGVALPVTPDPALFGDAKVGEIFEFLAQSSNAPQDQYQCSIQ